MHGGLFFDLIVDLIMPGKVYNRLWKLLQLVFRQCSDRLMRNVTGVHVCYRIQY